MTYTLTTADGRVLDATEEQTDIIDFAKANPKRNILINALAGAAKTSTLNFMCKYLPIVPTLSLAFNKRIAEEMAKVLPGHVRSATVNSVGHRVWASACGKKLVLDTKKNFNLVKEQIDKLPRGQRNAAFELFGDITKTVSKAKLSGYVPGALGAGKSLLTAQEFFDTLEEEPDDWFCNIVNEVLITGIRQAYGGLIDFDDQIYMPTLFGGSFPEFPEVRADEVQDFSKLNQAMLERLVRPGTRFAGVGDPWQSIYAFRGADTASMGWLRDRFQMHEMTLSVSFRCPQAVVKNVHKRVPHMKWAPWAAEGLVQTLGEWGPDSVPDGSAIICRNNAPLMTMAMALLRSGRGVKLIGTDLGPQLVKALKKLGDPGTERAVVMNMIDSWEQSKLAKSRDSGAVADRAACLRVFAEFGPTLGDAIAYCEAMFQASGPIQLLSGHKAKGLEFDTVFHLDPHRIPSPWAKEPEALEQERNLEYVIETRPKATLYKVRLDQFNGE